ncbi:hypothetical protein CONLIGDRAFT_264640 [Coniochaeta ligniaria NRRL 30616]|uniref:Uncharacterized protein n=1 Tax=Coniochaeta ligniaria NRRL 30616 TaxID=1408157 RepID=A0A1J7IYP4_9PEZI|nr:hypothetical protein CONLIGDRAFT_264640 [Coniochaeta ligniaria NRRL 30616]
MVILAASTMEPNVAVRQGSKQISIAGHVLKFAFQLQQAIRSLSQYLFLRAYFTASLVVYYVLFITQIFTFQSYLASRFVALKTASTLKSMLGAVWNSRRLKRLRKRIEFEFFAMILSPSGNNVFLLVFWPGWLLIAAAVWGLSIWAR